MARPDKRGVIEETTPTALADIRGSPDCLLARSLTERGHPGNDL